MLYGSLLPAFANTYSLGEIFMELQLLSKEQIEQAILRIEQIDLSNTSIDELKQILKVLFTGYTLDTPLITTGLDLFRGIIYDSKPTNISFLSYPPIKFAKENRASRQKQVPAEFELHSKLWEQGKLFQLKVMRLP